MVGGLDLFKEYFSPYIDQYVLIGGVACSILMAEAGLDFRATKDLDIVLYVEALHANFVKAFWRFVDFSSCVNPVHRRQENPLNRPEDPAYVKTHLWARPAFFGELGRRVEDRVR